MSTKYAIALAAMATSASAIHRPMQTESKPQLGPPRRKKFKRAKGTKH